MTGHIEENEPDYMEELLEDMEAREEIVSDIDAMAELLFPPDVRDLNDRTHVLALLTIQELTSIAEEKGDSPLNMQGLILDFIGDLIDFHNGAVLYSLLMTKVKTGDMTPKEALEIAKHTNIRPAAKQFLIKLLMKELQGGDSQKGQ